MTLGRALWVVWGNLARYRRSFVLASVGLVIGVATGTFFVALAGGVQVGVLNRIYPVNQIEIEPKSVAILGLEEQVIANERLGGRLIAELARLPGVTAVYPKQRSKLPARLWGGKSLFGYDARTEAFFDGLDPELVRRELFEMEGVRAKRAIRARRRPIPCKRDEECPLGQECGAAHTCRDVEFWERFKDEGIVMPCASEGQTEGCAPGYACVGGQCRETCVEDAACGAARTCATLDRDDPPARAPLDPAACQGDACLTVCQWTCASDQECPLGFGCGPTGLCERFACKLGKAELQVSDRARERVGVVVGRCANLVDPASPACEPLACPSGTYCAVQSIQRADGYCEQPIPVVLSPFLVEMFNSSAAGALGLRALDGTDALLGFQFQIHLGDSYFAQGVEEARQVIRRTEIVGFSNKALDFGVTMPLPYVRAINARYKGRMASDSFDTILLETHGNEDVSSLIAEADRRGFGLARKSKDAQKAADLLFILTVVFAFISVVIAAVAAINIGNTFLMIIAERRYEIGIMRAVGATRGHIRLLILLEASVLGLSGGVLGEAISYGFSRLANLVAAEHFAGTAFKPDNFFVYPVWLLAAGIGVAWVFCLVGAMVPASRAARLDPAVVLTS
jgi:ABC-type lipoprotein release transport system permease subunit